MSTPGIAGLDRSPARLRDPRYWVLVRNEWRRKLRTGEFGRREIHISFLTRQECGPHDVQDWGTLAEVRGDLRRLLGVLSDVAVAFGGRPLDDGTSPGGAS
jgi:hypothetical protein